MKSEQQKDIGKLPSPLMAGIKSALIYLAFMALTQLLAKLIW